MVHFPSGIFAFVLQSHPFLLHIIGFDLVPDAVGFYGGFLRI